MKYNYPNTAKAVFSIDSDEYQKQVSERQRKHLEAVRSNLERSLQPCLHNNCNKCCGTGIRKDGTACIHMISCPCAKCSPIRL